MGKGRGVGKAKAAGIGGHGDIQGLPDGQLRRHAHGLQQQKHKLSRRRGPGLQQKPFRIAGVGGVMIDAKGHPSAIYGLPLGEQGAVGDVHGQNMGRQKPCRGRQPLQQKAQPGRQILIGEDEGPLALLPQAAAQRRGTAHGIPVGPAMGQDQVIIVLQQPFAGLHKVNGPAHAGPPPRPPAPPAHPPGCPACSKRRRYGRRGRWNRP